MGSPFVLKTHYCEQMKQLRFIDLTLTWVTKLPQSVRPTPKAPDLNLIPIPFAREAKAGISRGQKLLHLLKMLLGGGNTEYKQNSDHWSG